MEATRTVKGLVGNVYDVLYDAAEKVWSLVKPIFLIGIVFDLVTNKLGWINQIVMLYKDVVAYTSTGSTLVVVIIGLLAVIWTAKK